MPDSRSDEALAASAHAGDNAALDALLERYQKDLWRYAKRNSWFSHDWPYLDDILANVLLVITAGIRKDKFLDDTPGSFHKWAYAICHREVLKQDEKRLHQPKAISTLYPEDSTGIPDDILTAEPMDTNDGETFEELEKALAQLPPDEQKLMRMSCQPRQYTLDDILKEPEFKDLTRGSLKNKICNVRKKLGRLMNKNMNDETR